MTFYYTTEIKLIKDPSLEFYKQENPTIAHILHRTEETDDTPDDTWLVCQLRDEITSAFIADFLDAGTQDTSVIDVISALNKATSEFSEYSGKGIDMESIRDYQFDNPHLILDMPSLLTGCEPDDSETDEETADMWFLEWFADDLIERLEPSLQPKLPGM